MRNIKELLERKDVLSVKGVSEEVILDAESKLNFKFPKEYKEFLGELGILSKGSNEILGLGVEGHLNIIEANLEEKKYNNLSEKYIIIKNEGTGIFILLGEDGKIYEYKGEKCSLLYNSFNEFLVKEII